MIGNIIRNYRKIILIAAVIFNYDFFFFFIHNFTNKIPIRTEMAYKSQYPYGNADYKRLNYLVVYSYPHSITFFQSNQTSSGDDFLITSSNVLAMKYTPPAF